MQIDEGKRRFIIAWGNLGNSWGICRTMAQIHGFLLITKEPASSDEVIQELQISRGNACMNIRALIDWGLVHKHSIPGDRKEYYMAEKDCWKAFRQILKKRKAKELDPMVELLSQISAVQGNCEESEEFCRMVHELKDFSESADKALDLIIQSDKNWLMSPYFKMLR